MTKKKFKREFYDKIKEYNIYQKFFSYLIIISFLCDILDAFKERLF